MHHDPKTQECHGGSEIRMASTILVDKHDQPWLVMVEKVMISGCHQPSSPETAWFVPCQMVRNLHPMPWLAGWPYDFKTMDIRITNG